MIAYLSVVLAGFLVGSIPTALWVERLRGRPDIRLRGSGNVGATNVLRTDGWRPALLVALVDIGKGWIAAEWVARLGPQLGEIDPQRALMAAGLAAVFGHIWPLFAGWRGGKGVATAGGVLLAIDAPSAALLLACFTIAVLLTRRASFGSLAAAAASPLVLWIRLGVVSHELVAFSAMLALLIFLTHRSNIRNLLAGREPRLGRRT